MAKRKSKIIKREGKPPLIVPPPGPDVRRPKGWKPPSPNTRRDKALQRFLDNLLKSKNKGGKVLYKRYGGMSGVGLHPAEEARAGTMPQMERRRYMKKGGKVYRKLGGKVTNGNDVMKMIYKGDN